MNTYLINAPHDHRIKTTEKVDTRNVLVYSNPAYYETKLLAKDFGDIDVGDQVIICRNSQLKYIAVIDEVIMATDQSGDIHDGLPVKILKGHVRAQCNKLSVTVFAIRMKKKGIDTPNLFNSKLSGFKQGAFAEKLTDDQVRVCM